MFWLSVVIETLLRLLSLVHVTGNMAEVAALALTAEQKSETQKKLLDFATDFKIPTELVKSSFGPFGMDEETPLEMVAYIPTDTITKTIAKIKTEDGTSEINPLQQGMLIMYFTKLKEAMATEKVAPKEPTKADTPTKENLTEAAGKRKISEVLDQMDDGAFEQLTPKERQQYRLNHIEKTGGRPPASYRPSAEQLGALKAKMDSGRPPIAISPCLVLMGVELRS